MIWLIKIPSRRNNSLDELETVGSTVSVVAVFAILNLTGPRKFVLHVTEKIGMHTRTRVPVIRFVLYCLKVSIGATGKSDRDIPVDLRRGVSVSSRRKSETVIWRTVFVDESEATGQVRTRSYFPRCTRRVFLRCNFRVNKSASDTHDRGRRGLQAPRKFPFAKTIGVTRPRTLHVLIISMSNGKFWRWRNTHGFA